MENIKDLKKDTERPSRYTGETGKDLIDLCQDLGINFTDAAKFNIFKYLIRAGRKEGNTALKDYTKAEVYLKRLIEFEQKKNISKII